MKETKNLYQRLVEVRKSVKYIQKTTDGYKFKYANEGQILAAIRAKMDEESVFLEMEMVSLEPVECHMIIDKQIKTLQGLKCVFEFTWTNADNPVEQIKKKMILQDSESIIKTCGGLMTYANKYFLYKFFSVPTDKLDPDAFDNSLEKILGMDSEEEEEVSIGEKELNNMKDLIKSLDNPNAESFMCNKANVKTLDKFPKYKYEDAMKYLERQVENKNKKENKNEQPSSRVA